jgi:hypothetical protein
MNPYCRTGKPEIVGQNDIVCGASSGLMAIWYVGDS